MENNVRPCVFWFMGTRYEGLFHCFGKASRKLGQRYDGETVAIVENKHGAILEVSTNNIHLLDSKEKIERYFKVMGEENCERCERNHKSLIAEACKKYVKKWEKEFIKELVGKENEN